MSVTKTSFNKKLLLAALLSGVVALALFCTEIYVFQSNGGVPFYLGINEISGSQSTATSVLVYQLQNSAVNPGPYTSLSVTMAAEAVAMAIMTVLCGLWLLMSFARKNISLRSTVFTLLIAFWVYGFSGPSVLTILQDAYLSTGNIQFIDNPAAKVIDKVFTIPFKAEGQYWDQIIAASKHRSADASRVYETLGTVSKPINPKDIKSAYLSGARE